MKNDDVGWFVFLILFSQRFNFCRAAFFAKHSIHEVEKGQLQFYWKRLIIAMLIIVITTNEVASQIVRVVLGETKNKSGKFRVEQTWKLCGLEDREGKGCESFEGLAGSTNLAYR